MDVNLAGCLFIVCGVIGEVNFLSSERAAELSGRLQMCELHANEQGNAPDAIFSHFNVVTATKRLLPFGPIPSCTAAPSFPPPP